jgi:hypothetical protein
MIATGIILIVIGAVLTFALNVQLDWVNLDLVGYLLMGAGAVVLIIGLVLMTRKRQSITTVHSGVDPASGATVSERRTAVTPDELP